MIINPQYPPEIKIAVKSSSIFKNTDDFLGVTKSEVNFHYPDHSISKEFTINHVVRDKMDAVAIVAHFMENNLRMIYLRSCVRPALMLRDYHHPLEDRNVGNLWEIPAGLLEHSEESIVGIFDAAVREGKEELGFDFKREQFSFLGKRIFGSPGINAGRIFLVETQVDPRDRSLPTEDGSPMEKFGEVIAIPLFQAINWVDNGLIMDPKTEIGIRRLSAKYGESR